MDGGRYSALKVMGKPCKRYFGGIDGLTSQVDQESPSAENIERVELELTAVRQGSSTTENSEVIQVDSETDLTAAGQGLPHETESAVQSGKEIEDRLLIQAAEEAESSNKDMQKKAKNSASHKRKGTKNEASSLKDRLRPGELKASHRCASTHWWLLLMVLMLKSVTQSNGVQSVNQDSLNSYLRMILEEFGINPTDGKFLNIINPPRNGTMKEDFSMPKIFIWSPQEQFLGCTLRCPVHKCTLQPWKFTSEAGTKDSKPRLLFDLFGNVLLVQRIYLCKIRGHPHKIVASSYYLMLTLPRYIQNFFPITVFARSG